jgi:sugar lactone lactonase YvrE
MQADASKSLLTAEKATPVTAPVWGEREPILLWEEISHKSTTPVFVPMATLLFSKTDVLKVV